MRICNYETGVWGAWNKIYAGYADSAATASTATRLATARTISLTGSVTGSGSFDGSGNLSIATTTNHAHDRITNGQDHLLIQRNNRTLLSVRSSETVPSFAFEKYNDVNKLQWHVYSDNGEYLRTNVLLDDYNWNNYIPLSSYLSLSGGTMTGALNFKNSTWNLVGDDAYMGDND
jgi:hypothetical protein